MKRTHRGFTLIELLVVIAIIAILAAILFPVFAQAREKARAITCASNTKQLALAITMYEQDFDDYTPPGFGLYSRGTGWAGQVFPYVKSVKAFECPDDSAGTGNFTSYGININLSASAVGYVSTVSGAPYYGAGIPLWQGKSIATLNSPSKTVMLFEVSGSQAYPAHQGFPDYDITQPDEGAPSNESTMFFTGGSATGDGTAGGYSPEGAGEWDHTTPYSAAQLQTLQYATGYLGGITPPAPYTSCFTGAMGRHSGGANYVFNDGHVKWLLPGAVSPGHDAYLPTDAQGSVTPQEAAGTDGKIGNNAAAATFSIN